MKSIMEEASSISKAIDQAWNRAGKPSEFTVKVLETPERNLFGLTVKSAKIAFFFDEQKVMIKFAQPVEKVTIPAKSEVVQREVPQHPIPPKEVAVPGAPQRSHWDDDMAQTATDWIRQMLQIMGLPNIAFTTTTSTNGLTFRFKSSITGNELKDRLLFSSFAHLILTTLRQKFKKAFKHLKVILITESTPQ